MNMGIWVIGTSNALFIRDFYTQINQISGKTSFCVISSFCTPYFLVPNCRWGSHSIFWKISPPISLYYDFSRIKNFYKTTNHPSLIKLTPFCVYDLTGRNSSVFFKLTPLPLTLVEYR